MPTNSKDYIHRVGRTARAGRSGKSITLVSQYDVEILQRIEHVIGLKMDNFAVDKQAVALLSESVQRAGIEAAAEMKELGAKGGQGGKRGRGFGADDDRDRDDDVVESGMPVSKRGRGGSRGGGGGRGRGGGGGRGRGGRR